LFIRTKRDWKQTYFCLVKAYRDDAERPRQRTYHLGKTLNLSAEQWAVILLKVQEHTGYHVADKVCAAVRNYAKKHGLPLKLSHAVRAGARLNHQAVNEEYRRKRERVAKERGYATVALLEAAEAAQREREKAAFDARWKAFTDAARGRGKRNEDAAQLLGVTYPHSLTVDAIKKAYRTKAMATHPDHGGDAAQFRALVEARDALLQHLGTTGSRSVAAR
jgi:hypothetical protein